MPPNLRRYGRVGLEGVAGVRSIPRRSRYGSRAVCPWARVPLGFGFFPQERGACICRMGSRPLGLGGARVFPRAVKSDGLAYLVYSDICTRLVMAGRAPSQTPRLSTLGFLVRLPKQATGPTELTVSTALLSTRPSASPAASCPPGLGGPLLRQETLFASHHRGALLRWRNPGFDHSLYPTTYQGQDLYHSLRISSLARTTLVWYDLPMGRISPDEAERRLQSRLKERHLWERIGHRIRQRRIALDMSVEELAEKVGLGVNAIYRIEVGVLGTVLNRLQDFANALQMDLIELVEEEPDPTLVALRAAFRGMPLTPEQIEEMARYAHEHFRPEGGSRQDS